MAAPALLGGISLATSAIGGGISAFGAYSAGQSQAAMANYQSAVAQINAKIAEENAQYAEKAGEVEAQQTAMGVRARIGATKAQQGASNLDVNRGSAVDVRASEAEIGAQDQAMVRANAARTAYGYRTQKLGFEAQSALDTAAARNARTASGFNVASSLIGGASSVSDRWYRMTQSGISPSLVSEWPRFLMIQLRT